MCGIAGVVDVAEPAPVEQALLERMARAIIHRGPDQDGYFRQPGLGLASRRLSIVGIESGRQPIFNEDRSVVVVYNGELFDYPERRRELEARGHRFATDTDTELLVHLWEEQGPAMLPTLRGQFAFALADLQQNRVVLARDKMGICPLYWAIREERLYFGSEIKAILASGAVQAQLDPRALDHVFSFFAMGTRRTMFGGVSALLPGHYLEIYDGRPRERRYWDLDFPDAGQGESPPDIVERFADTLGEAVRIRLRADVPVVSYLSGGVDSTTIACLAGQALGRSLPTFTIQIAQTDLDETDRAMMAARTIGSEPLTIRCGNAEIAASYPDLLVASESPVIDTSSAAIYRLATAVREQGYKVALTGEGADEALAGYPWHKSHRLMEPLDRLGLGAWLRRAALFLLTRGRLPWSIFDHRYRLSGGYHGTSDLYAGCSLSGHLAFSREFRHSLGGHMAVDDLELDLDGMRRWDPLNRALYLGYKVMLPGLLMSHKGDRPAMANSVETRFPFLDDRVIDLCCRVRPDWKLHSLRRDKHLLRCFASTLLPAAIADRPKSIFRARYAGSFLDPMPNYVAQLLSKESLEKTGYFEVGRLLDCVARVRSGRLASMGVEVAVVGAVSTQLWHHLFLGGGLCELTPWSPA
ncbi:MAG: asparagine synthase (glutamine-hydrolyzing) [Candidatus Eremiobacteraeota bacterium]|nr:asparagine synthase (glutamine-hydrolyzing) [Candidatus Eremiobacteraeota bacterium]